MGHTNLLSAIRQYLRKIVLFTAIFFFPNMGYAIGTLAGIYLPEVYFEKNNYARHTEESTSTMSKASYYIEPTLSDSDYITGISGDWELESDSRYSSLVVKNYI